MEVVALLVDTSMETLMRLPAHVRVDVNGISGCRLNSKYTLTVRKGPAAVYCSG
jgi:hypothetical protein